MQLDLLKYLIKDTRKGVNIGRDENDKIVAKYHITDYMDLDYYWKSREGKDSFANNTCHLCFKIEDANLRYNILQILIEEVVGDVNKPNNLGYLPHEVMHDQQILDFPKSIDCHFKMNQQEILEADYMIISS